MTAFGNPANAAVATSATRPAKPTSAPWVSEPLTLQQAIETALANNPEVAARRWDEAAARAQSDVAAGVPWPNVHVVGGYNRFLDDQRLVPATANNEPGVFSSDIVTGDLVVTMPIYTGGQISNRIRAAELLSQSAGHRLARTREELVFNISSVFFSMLGQQHVIGSLQASREALQEHRKRVAEMIDAQKAAKVDLLRTEVRLANVEQQLLQEQNVLAIQRRVLANLLGLEVADAAVQIRGELQVPDPGVLPPVEPAQVYARRADYQAAQLETEAQARRVDAAKGAQWPSVFLRGAYGGRYGLSADAPDRTDNLADVGFVGVLVNVPLFEGGAIRARIREERARSYAALERLRRLNLQVRQEVETALLNVQSSRNRIHVTRKSVDQAREGLRIEREKYELGKGSITDVLDAQAASLEAETTHYRALADHETAKAQLRLAIGDKP
jgi:outer membrane protein TolC